MGFTGSSRRQGAVGVRAVVAGAGLVAVLAALSADRIGFGQPGAMGRGQILLLAFGVMAILIGALGTRFLALYRYVAVLLVSTVVVLAAVELLAIIAARTVLEQTRETPLLSYYLDQEWGQRYWAEFNASQEEQYVPYVVWSGKHFAGKTINLDDQGRRKVPGAACEGDAYRLFTFGGSTMLGTGAPDGETIAAHLQTGLEKTHSQPVCVVNFGQSGWVSTQSLIQLVGELQAGRVPDAVLFYDGLNEVLAIHESEQPGAHVSLSRTASLFEQSIPPLWTFVRSSRTYGLISRRSAGRRERCEMQTPDAEERASNLAQRATDVYLGNYRLVESLASAFDFDFSFFLQPHPATSGKVLTREEVKIMAESDPALSQVAVRFYEDVGRLSPTRPRLWSLARVLDRETETIWIDATGHMTPGGNRIVASAMLDVLNQGSGG